MPSQQDAGGGLDLSHVHDREDGALFTLLHGSIKTALLIGF
jgi:hypothetical protein